MCVYVCAHAHVCEREGGEGERERETGREGGREILINFSLWFQQVKSITIFSLFYFLYNSVEYIRIIEIQIKIPDFLCN